MALATKQKLVNIAKRYFVEDDKLVFYDYNEGETWEMVQRNNKLQVRRL